MEISFKSGKLCKTCPQKAAMQKAYGKLAPKLSQRLMELYAATTLAEMSHLPPPRCHELEGQRAGQFAVDLDKNYRLIFTPDHDPVPRKDDGGIDLAQVTEITILEITDYH